MKRRILARAAAAPLVVLAALVAGFPSKAAASCITQGTQYWNNTSELNQDPSIPRPMSGRVWRPAGTTPYLAVPMGGKLLNIYNLTSAATPNLVGSFDLWAGFLQTIQTYPFGFISVVDGQTIGYASFNTDGYVIFRFTPATSSVEQLYKVDRPNSAGLTPAHLVTIGGQLYLVGRIPTIVDGETYMSGFSVYSVDSSGTPQRVSGHDYGWSSNDIERCFVVQSSDQADTYVYVQNDVTGGMDIWKITTPARPVLVKSTSLGAPSYLVRDASNPNLGYFIYTNLNSVEVVDLTDPQGPVDRGSVPVKKGQVGWGAAMDGLLYLPISATSKTTGAAYTVSLPTIGGLASVVAVEDQAGVLTRPPVTMESPLGAAVYKASGLYYLYREELGIGDVITVDPACLSTTPVPSFTVTGNASATCTPGTLTNLLAGPIGKAFPGDKISITNTSTGAAQTATLEIDYFASTAVVPLVTNIDVKTNPTYLWDTRATRPTGFVSPPGEYQAVLTLTDAAGTPYQLKRSIWLCGDPHAALGFGSNSSAAMLVGETVNLTAAASTGNPTGYDFLVTVPSGSPASLTSSAATASYPLPQASGSYGFTVVAHYDFTGSDTTCAALRVPSNYLTGTYNSCAALTVNAGYGVSSFDVMQNGQVVVPSGGSAAILADQDTTLRFTGRVASGFVPNFVWSIPNVSSSLPCAFTAAPYTLTTCPSPTPIAGGTWPAGSPVAMNMNLQICPSGSTPGVDCSATAVATLSDAPTTTVTPQQVSAVLNATSASVDIGQAVTFSVSNPQPAPSSFSSLILNLPAGAACNAQTAIQLCPAGCSTAINTASVTFQNTTGALHTYTATLSGFTAVGGVKIPVLSTVQVTVGTTGNCTTSVALTAQPNPAPTGTPVTFTVTPGLQTSGDSLVVDFGDRSTPTAVHCFVSFPCSTVSHTYTTAGTFSASASGTLGGVSAATSTPTPVTITPATSVTVAITPPNPAQVNTLGTFLFSPSLSKSTDTLTFDFGDGSSTPVTGSSFAPVSSVSHTYTTASTYLVSATGWIGGTSATGSTSVVVQSAASGGLTVAASPNPANVGDTVSITFTPMLSQAGDSVTIHFGDGSQQLVAYPFGCSFGQCGAGHVYTTASSFPVSASGTAGGKSVSGTLTLVAKSNCLAASAPVANFTWSPPQPRVGQPVQFTDASTGVAPTSWSWNFGDGSPFAAPGTSTQANPAYTFSTAKTCTVTLISTNCRGSSQKQLQVQVLSACDQTAAPAANFTWAPQGPLTGFPEQQQPYAGQPITLTDASTASPTSWHWYDFNELAMNQTVATPAFTFTWPANQPAGPKNVRMTATNCVGTSAEVAKTMTIYPDVRHVVADFSWGSGTLSTGAPVTLVAAQGPSYGDPDTFAWTFDDGSAPQTGSSTTHTFNCAGQHTVTLTASRGTYTSAPTPHALTLTGQQCGPVAVMTVDAAKVNGLNGTTWRTNVRIFNPSSQVSTVTVEFLPIGWNNSSPPNKVMTLAPKATWVLDDVLAWAQSEGVVGADVKKAALRVLYENADHVAPVVLSQTYTSPQSGGGTYGQLAPGIEVVPNTTQPVLWITGIRNNGTTTGFRTNYSLVNLRDTGVANLQFTLFDATGKSLATSAPVTLGPFEYRQDSLANLLGGTSAATSPDPLAVKVVVPAGADVQAYTSVVDNLTGDPVLIPAVPPPSAPIFIPAVAYTSGVNGTVWRSDLQITNPDTVPHTWTVTYTPGGGQTLGIITQKPTIAPQSSVRYDDLLSWLYSNKLTDADKTSGVVEITTAPGDTVYPIVQARSFNQTANGTYGQNITPITPDMGVAAGQGKRLLLTGMSSQDIARTNLGFVNLSDSSGVNFSVMFYDQGGNVLNKKDGQGQPIPYTFALGVGGWDQDKLENRFQNVFGTALPANLTAISAVIQVTDGGPGTVYATVIDNLTGDPNFILAQPAP